MLVVPEVAFTERSSNLLGVPMVKVLFEQLLGSLLKVFLAHLRGRGGHHIGRLWGKGRVCAHKKNIVK